MITVLIIITLLNFVFMSITFFDSKARAEELKLLERLSEVLTHLESQNDKKK